LLVEVMTILCGYGMGIFKLTFIIHLTVRSVNN
jgi:hypothetical protein